MPHSLQTCRIWSVMATGPTVGTAPRASAPTSPTRMAADVSRGVQVESWRGIVFGRPANSTAAAAESTQAPFYHSMVGSRREKGAVSARTEGARRASGFGKLVQVMAWDSCVASPDAGVLLLDTCLRESTRRMCVEMGCFAPLSVGKVALRRYGTVNYSRNSACDLCCVPNVA